MIYFWATLLWFYSFNSLNDSLTIVQSIIFQSSEICIKLYIPYQRFKIIPSLCFRVVIFAFHNSLNDVHRVKRIPNTHHLNYFLCVFFFFYLFPFFIIDHTVWLIFYLPFFFYDFSHEKINHIQNHFTKFYNNQFHIYKFNIW